MMGDAVIRRAKRLTSAQICTDNSAEAPKLHASSVYLGLGPIVLLPQFSRHNPLPVPSERTGGAEMMRYLAAALVVLAAPVSADPIGDGSALVQENCARCHGVTAEDHSPNPRAIPFRFLGRLYPIESLGEALAEGIMVSHEMPEFVLEHDEVLALIAYLDSIQVR